MIELTIILLTIAGLSLAAMDRIQFHYFESIFKYFNPKFWNPEISWKNKYINKDVSLGRIKWWIINKPVFLTDGWHLMKAIFLSSIALAICVNMNTEWHILMEFILVRLFLGLSFVIGYNVLWKDLD